MSRSRSIVLESLVALALVATGLAWLAARPLSPVETTATAPPATSLPCAAQGGEVIDLPMSPVPENARREVQTAKTDPPRPVAPQLVIVHGQVRRSGRPVADYDLAFQPMGEGADQRDDDWDSTDADGRYTVELRAERRFVVLNDDEGPWVTEVVVPAGQRELILDIDLPHGI